MANIFVSYARESEVAVQDLAADVETLDHTVWVDHDLKGGKAWWDEILTRIRDCQIFMMALSPESLTSPACKREYRYAADLGKPILPILIAEGVSLQTLPSKLSQIHYVDYRKRDTAAALKLAGALNAVPPAPALPNPLPDPPAVPVSYLSGLADQIDSNPVLGSKDQSALVSELRRGLRDPETEAGARELLARLRTRSDLYANIRDEIDELLQEPATAISKSRPVPSKSQIMRGNVASGLQRTLSATQPTMADPSEDRHPPRTNVKPITRPERIAIAIAGSIVGAALGAMAFTVENVGHDVYSLTVIPALAGAVAGAISARNARVIGIALLGGVVAGVVAIPLLDATGAYSQGMRHFWTATAVLSAPPGVIVGAMVGAKIGRRLGWL